MIWRAAVLVFAVGLAGCSQGTDPNSRLAEKFFEEMKVNLPLQADAAAQDRPADAQGE